MFSSHFVRASAGSAVLMITILTAAACGNSNGSPTTPTTPTPTTPAANRAPQITAATVTPANGIATLTTHAFSASATDPDGDPLTYSWNFGNSTSAATAGASVVYSNANTTTYQATLTVTDSKGASTSSTVPVVSATMAGTFTGELIGAPLSVTLTQLPVGGIVGGTWEVATLGFVGEVGPAGEPGVIRANGEFELRFKVRVGAFIDFYYRGTMDTSGRTLTGTLQGSGFTGEGLVLTKQ